MLLSYIPVSPSLPQYHYNIEKTALLNGNDLWQNRHKKNGRFARIYHKTTTIMKNEELRFLPWRANDVKIEMIAVRFPTHRVGGVQSTDVNS